MNVLPVLQALSMSSAAAAGAHATSFTPLDWGIVVVYLIASIAVGVYANKFISKLSDYLVAGRGLGIYLAVATMTGTELGLVTVMYNAEEGFRSGFSAFTTGLIACVTSIIIGLTGVIIMRLRREGVMTIPEYYERRFGPKVRWLGGVLLSISLVLNFALFLKVGATFVTNVTGLENAYVSVSDDTIAAASKAKLPPEVMKVLGEVKGKKFDTLESLDETLAGLVAPDVVKACSKTIGAHLEVNRGVALKLVMVVMLALVLLYTTLGGMVSVVITDFIQFLVLSVAMVLATWFAFAKLGGWGAMVHAVQEYKGVGGFDPIQAGRYGWTFVLWMAFLNFAAEICWLPSTMRALSAKDETVAKRLYMWSGLSFLIRCIVPMLWGIAAFTLIKATPELSAQFFPADGVALKEPIEAMPVLFAHILPVGMIGLVTAGMLAAFMSTHDSYLLAGASVITQDVIAPLFGQRLGDKQRIKITRILVLLLGAYVLAFGLFYSPPESIWKYMAATGTIYLPGAIACLAAGIYWKRASSVGAALAIGFGLFGLAGIVDWPAVGERFGLDWMKAVDQDKIAMVTIALCASGMILGSLLFPDRERAAEPAGTAPERGAPPHRGCLYPISVVLILAGMGVILVAGIAFGLSASFWKVVFIVGGSLFATMALIIAVLGFKDLREMLRLLSEQAAPQPAAEKPEQGADEQA